MRAAVFQGPGRPHLIATVPDPAPGPRDIVLRVERCGICGTDLHASAAHDADPMVSAFVARYRPGVILGHEFSGIVVEKGAEVLDVRIGERMTSMGVGGCGACAACAAGDPLACAGRHPIQGGYAEFVLTAASCAARVPQGLDADDGALMEPLAASLHALDAAGVGPGTRLLVIGAGAIGLGAVFMARRSGAARIAVAARSRAREPLARALGADAFVQAGDKLAVDAADALGGAPDVVLDGAGARGVIAQAMLAVKPRGTVAVSGMCLTADATVPALGVLKELRIQYALCYRLADFERVARVLLDEPGLARQMIGATLSLDEFPDAFDALRERNPHCKVLVKL
jgi:threonine dehydrogenase-like Zn-dependent dehydrogenase